MLTGAVYVHIGERNCDMHESFWHGALLVFVQPGTVASQTAAALRVPILCHAVLVSSRL